MIYLVLGKQRFKKRLFYFTCMSDSSKTIIKYFCDRFLRLEYYPTSIKSVLELTIDKLKDVTQEEYNKFKEIDLNTIKDISTIETSNLEKLSKKTKISYSLLKNSLIASKLIANAWNKRNAYLKKPQMKVVIAGLDFAGKTSLINRLVTNQGYRDLINLNPTVGANVEEFQTDRLSLVIWDLGGQKNHIDEYISEPESFFVQVDVLIFVIDSQDDNRYDQASKYFADIVNTLEFLNENPFLLILMNKVDTDLVDEPDFQIKLEYITDKISNLFMSREKSWTFEIIPTSIYNYYRNQPEIAKSIKSIFSKEPEINQEQKFVNIEEKLQTILDINLNLLDKVVSELAEIKRIIARVFPSDLVKSISSVPFEKVHSEYVSKEDRKKKTKNGDSKKKGSKISERKSSKTSAGPPERLKVIPSKEKDPLCKIKNSQEEKVKNEQNESTVIPAFMPEQKEVIIDRLKPPIPPKSIPSIFSHQKPSRKEIISELKEMFVKRGIVR